MSAAGAALALLSRDLTRPIQELQAFPSGSAVAFVGL